MASTASTRMLGSVNARSPLISARATATTANSRPRVGTARTELASDTSQRSCPVWPTHSPNGIAMRRGEQDRHRGVLEVLEHAVGDAVLALPVGRVGEPRQDRADHARAPCTWSQGVTRRVPSDDDRVEGQGEQHAGDDAGEQLARDHPVVAVDEEVSELADADQGGDADDADVAHGGDPQARGDHRHGKRQLDAEQARERPCSPWRSPPARRRRARRRGRRRRCARAARRCRSSGRR